jgi:hypothetical protein
MPGEEPFAYYGTGRGASACWQNSVTRASVRELLTVDNMCGADFLAPTPGLIVHGVQDACCSPEGAREAYERMGEPKRMVWLDARLHIDLYDTEPHVAQAVEAVRPSWPGTCDSRPPGGWHAGGGPRRGAGHPGRLPPAAAAGRSSPSAGRPSTGVPRSVTGIRLHSCRPGRPAGTRRHWRWCAPGGRICAGLPGRP